MKTTLDFLLAGSQVTRYHTVTTLVRETVGHHSHGVAALALLIKPDASRSLLLAALFHDLAEHMTGDIPSPAKREYGIGEQVTQLENRLMLEAGIVMPELSAEEERVLKLADIAHGALYCCREVCMGNQPMKDIYHRYVGYAEQMLLRGRERELFNIIKEKCDVRS